MFHFIENRGALLFYHYVNFKKMPEFVLKDLNDKSFNSKI